MRAARSWCRNGRFRHLEKAANPHILMLSPPLDMKEKWFAPHTAYSMAKFGMSMVVLGLAGELRGKGIAVNALWPRTVIATAAVQNLLGGDAMMHRRASRTSWPTRPMRSSPSRRAASPAAFSSTTPFWRENGVTDFDRYRVDPAQPLARDFFVPDDIPPPPHVETVDYWRPRCDL